MRAVVYDFADSRAGEHARTFLGDWQGKLVCDDYGGYKAGFQQGIIEIGCAAHARRKFFDLHASNKSQIAEQALKFFAALYDVEREAVDLTPDKRRALRQLRAKPVAEALHTWMTGQRKIVPEGSAIAKALDYSLKRWEALTRYLEDGDVPVDNNPVHAASGMNHVMPTPRLCRVMNPCTQWMGGSLFPAARIVGIIREPPGRRATDLEVCSVSARHRSPWRARARVP